MSDRDDIVLAFLESAPNAQDRALAKALGVLLNRHLEETRSLRDALHRAFRREDNRLLWANRLREVLRAHPLAPDVASEIRAVADALMESRDTSTCEVRT